VAVAAATALVAALVPFPAALVRLTTLRVGLGDAVAVTAPATAVAAAAALLVALRVLVVLRVLGALSLVAVALRSLVALVLVAALVAALLCLRGLVALLTTRLVGLRRLALGGSSFGASFRGASSFGTSFLGASFRGALLPPPWAALIAATRSAFFIPAALMPRPPATCLSSGSSMPLSPLPCVVFSVVSVMRGPSPGGGPYG